MAEATKTNFFDKRTVLKLLLLILGTLIYSMGVVWFLNVGVFFAGGVTGISQIFSYLIFGGIKPWLSYLIPLINLPLFIIGWKKLSLKFAVFTIVSVVLQAIFIHILGHLSDHYGLNPIFSVVREYGTVVQNEAGLWECQNISAGLRLTLAMIGGFVCSSGASLCLISGGSTGGMDVVSNALLTRRHISFAKVSFAVDFCIMLSSGIIVSFSTALFTMVRIIINALTIDKFYRIYQYIKIEIITEKGEEVKNFLLSKFYHGMTIYSAVGGFTSHNKSVIEIVASRFEMIEYTNQIIKIDPSAFITISHVTTVKGKYVNKTII